MEVLLQKNGIRLALYASGEFAILKWVNDEWQVRKRYKQGRVAEEEYYNILRGGA